MEDILVALSALLYNAGTDGYKIFYEDELEEAFPPDLRNRETLEAALKKLVSDGCVDVKYVRGEVFCIAVLKEYEPTKEPDSPQPEQEEKPALNVNKVYAFAALSAFLGGALGGCVTAIIAAVV